MEMVIGCAPMRLALDKINYVQTILRAQQKLHLTDYAPKLDSEKMLILHPC
jgi:hypothetical protein